MIQFVRIFGVILIVAGVITILSWLIKPLRELWPFLLNGFRELPIALQIGLVMAAIGFLMLISSLIWERIEDRKQEQNLLDDQ